jgi:hypothetical protein
MDIDPSRIDCTRIAQRLGERPNTAVFLSGSAMRSMTRHGEVVSSERQLRKDIR